MSDWHIITGEYPPQPGGVSDYTRLVAEELARAGDSITVWAPGLRMDDPQSTIHNLTVERLPDHFGVRSLRHLSRELDRRPGPRRLLVQYVPHAFGWKGGNLAFCAWLRARRRRDSIWVMFHEVWYPFGRDDSLAHNGLAAVNRLMAALVGAAAERAFVSIPAWTPLVRRVVGGRPVDWLPVPSSVPPVADACEAARVRARYGRGSPLVGHFGTYGRSIASMLIPAIRSIARRTTAHVLLLGRRGDQLAHELLAGHPDLEGRVSAAGSLSLAELSNHIAACDVMVQPYPDGISTRRTSAMAALALGRPIVTTSGWLTERVWEETEAVALVSADDPDAVGLEVARLIDDESARAGLSDRARSLYSTRFDIRHTIAALRAAP